MPKFKNIALFLFMHAGFLLYSFYTVLGKFASAYNFLSIEWILFYCGLLLIIFIYAILWQQVLKH
ncbi:MAG: transporter, partial [Treponema sp.]|nr:transporter [Treponema sp.]